MKKIMLLLVLCATMFAVNSQTIFSPTTANSTGAVTNATTDTLNLIMPGVYVSTMSVQALLTKTSGTIAGTVRLYGSNFNNVAGTWVAVGDTLTLSNAATNAHTWLVTTPSYKYYQLLQSGGTTMAGILQARVLVIKP